MPTVYDDYASRIVSEEALLEELLAGELSSSTQIQHAPWTGTQTLSLEDIPALAAVLKEPQARMAQRFRQPAYPWVTLLYGGLALATSMGWLELLPRYVWWMRQQDHLEYILSHDLGAFWGWMLPPEVNLGNGLLLGWALLFLPLWAMARLERALGSWHVLLAVAGSAVLVGTITTWGTETAVMYPLVAMAILGATLGLQRHRPLLPPLHRSLYGWGLVAMASPVLVVFTLVGLDQLLRRRDPFFLHHLAALVLAALLAALPPQVTRSAPWPYVLAAILLVLSPFLLLLS